MNYVYFVICMGITLIGALITNVAIVMMGMFLAGGFIGREVESMARKGKP